MRQHRFVIPKSIIETCGVILLTLLVYAVYRNFSLDITIALIFILGAWAIDNYLKNRFHLKDYSGYADLSFAALIFMGGHEVERISNFTDVGNEIILSIGVFCFLLTILWIWNLGVSQYRVVGNRNPEKDRKIAIYQSIGLAILSVIFALLPFYLGLL